MKFLLAIIVALAAGVLPVQAARPSEESLNEMIRVMEVQKTIDLMLAQVQRNMKSGMEQSLQAALKGAQPTAQQREAEAKFQQKANDILKEELSFAKLKQVYLQAYGDTFTQDEVDKIIAFYGSPAGKALVEKIPVAMEKANTILQGRMGPMMQKLQKLQDDFNTELSKAKS
jgi:uncharacterized protein